MKHIPTCLIAILVLLLTACQTPMISDWVARSGEKVFWDDFSDDSGNWPQMADSNGSLGIINGAYRIQVLSTDYELLATPGHTFRDVQVEVDTLRIAGPVQNLSGLVCRASNLRNLYFLLISNDGYYALGKIKNGKTSLLGQEMMNHTTSINQGNASNHLRLDCVGKTLKGYVNSQVIAISNDSDFSSGDVGLVAGTLDSPGVDVAFDDFIVYKP
jgi:hypothetical protein